MLADKDYETEIDTLLPFGKEFICVTPPNPRALPGDKLAEQIRAQGGIAKSAVHIEEAIGMALEAAGESETVIAFGSLYLAGAVRSAFPDVWKSFSKK